MSNAHIAFIDSERSSGARPTNTSGATSYSGPDEAVAGWCRGNTIGSHSTGCCPTACDTQCTIIRLAVKFNEACEHVLCLNEYRYIDFVGLVPGVVLKSYIAPGRTSTTFVDVTFSNVQHQIIVLPEATPSHYPNGQPVVTPTVPFRYVGLVTYDNDASLNIVALPNAMGASVARATAVGVNDSKFRQLGAMNPMQQYQSTQRLGDAFTDFFKNITDFFTGSRPASSNQGYPAILPPPAIPFTNQALPLTPTLPNTTGILVDSNCILRVSGPMSLNAPNLNVLGFFNVSGTMEANVSSLIFGSGVVFTGSGNIRLFRTNGDPNLVYIVGSPSTCAITATSGSQVIDHVNIIANIGSSTTIIAQRNNERPLAYGSVDASAPAYLFLNTRVFSVSRGSNLNAPSPLGSRYESNDRRFVVPLATSTTSPVIQLRNSTINGTNIGTVMYATNDISAVVYATDFVASRPYELPSATTVTGPILASFGSSSLIYNGATFILPVVIRSDYVHSRLDGTIFYVDAGNTHLGDALTTNEKCNSRCSKIAITLPSGSLLTPGIQSYGTATSDFDPATSWSGRLIEYKRIDCNSSARVEIKLFLEGRETCLTLDHGQAFKLHNLNGVWYVLSRVPRY